jgi:hypothetical protein
MTEHKPDIARWRLYAGWTLVGLGCASPLLVPAILRSPLSAGVKAALSALTAFGLPEILILLALPLLGKERIQALFRTVMNSIRHTWDRIWHR